MVGKKTLNFIVGLVFATGLGFVCYKVALGLVEMLAGISSDTAKVLVTSILGVVASVVVVAVSKYFERKLQIEQENRKQKMPVYEKFMTFFNRLIRDSKDPKTAMTADDMQQFIREFTPQIIVWGSDDFLRKYAAFMKTAIKAGETGKVNGPEMLLGWEDLMRTIRLDFGHENKNFSKYLVTSLYINDVPEK